MRHGIRLAPLALLALPLLASLVTACATPQVLPTSPEDCLIVVKSEFINKANVAQGRDYYFVLEGDYSPVKVRWGYTAFIVREPAVNFVKLTSKVRQGYRGEPGSDDMDVTLPYRPGFVVIADFVFSHTVTQKADNSFLSNSAVRDITEAERVDLLAKLKSDKSLSGWQF